MRKGQHVTVDVGNETDVPERVVSEESEGREEREEASAE
jgi:hypothetical protein